jgi:hypothetical protein
MCNEVCHPVRENTVTVNCSLIFKPKRHNRNYSAILNVYRLHINYHMTKKNQDNSFNFRFHIGNGQQSKRLLANFASGVRRKTYSYILSILDNSFDRMCFSKIFTKLYY